MTCYDETREILSPVSLQPSLRCRAYFSVAFALSALLMIGIVAMALSPVPFVLSDILLAAAGTFAVILYCLTMAVQECNT